MTIFGRCCNKTNMFNDKWLFWRCYNKSNMFNDKRLFWRCYNKSNMFNDKWLYSVGAATQHVQWQMTLFCRCCNKSNMFIDKWLYSVGAARKIKSSITNNSNLYVLQQKEHIQWQTNIYSSILYSIFCRYNKWMSTQYSVLYILYVLQPKEHIQWQMNIYSSIQYSTFCGCCKCNITLHQLPLLCMTSIPNDQNSEDFSLQTVTTESTHKGVKQCLKDVTQTLKRRPESPTVTLVPESRHTNTTTKTQVTYGNSHLACE